MNRYTKALVAAVQVITQGLEITYGGAHWLPAVTGALGAFLVYAVPNLSPAATVPAPPAAPAPAALRAVPDAPAAPPGPQGARCA